MRTPEHRMTGVPQRVGDPLKNAPDAPRERSAGRPALIDILPTFDVVAGYFNHVTVPAGFTAPAGTSALYIFQSLRVPRDTGQPVGLAGVQAEILPTDSAGAGDGVASNPIVWGATTGYGAAIIVGVDLPGTFQTWSAAPIHVPGVETSGDSLLGARNIPRYAFVSTMPTGKLNDTTPNKLTIIRSYAPYIIRVPDGSRLDFGLVVRASQIAAGAGTLVGGAWVQAMLALTQAPQSFGT